ncbi:arabinose operon transcriptional regulator AraC [Gallibacterium trehalosifermentans]|uniref:Arabinose operon transcriptional regulator AraC n=1 Tax=Gallibacterium trehalosifermentans TaxID=516935 RepID=A0ABV6H1M9_9PAST
MLINRLKESSTNLLLGNKLIGEITRIEKGNRFDFEISKPDGLQGYILQLTTFGKGYIFDGERYFSTSRGELLLFSPKSFYKCSRHPKNQYWHYKWIYFLPNPQWDKWLIWSNTKNGIGKITINDEYLFQEISQLFTKIEIEYKSHNNFREEMSYSLLNHLLLKCMTLENIQPTQVIDERIITICQLIKNDLSLNTSIDNLAKQVFLSPSRISRLFKHSLGISITQWREQERITEAKKFLYFSDISINTLAKNLGYDDPLYFSKVFKKNTGFSPSQYREIERNREK